MKPLVYATEPLPERCAFDLSLKRYAAMGMKQKSPVSTDEFHIQFHLNPAESITTRDSTDNYWEQDTYFLHEQSQQAGQDLITFLARMVPYYKRSRLDLISRLLIDTAQAVWEYEPTRTITEELVKTAEQSIYFEKLAESIEACRLEALLSSDSNTLRAAIQQSEESTALIEMGVQAAEWTLERIRRCNEPLPEFAAGVYFYLFEKLRYKPAMEYLVNVIIAEPIEIPGIYAPHLAAHALKVIRGDSDVDNLYYHYNTKARANLLKRFLRTWMTAM